MKKTVKKKEPVVAKVAVRKSLIDKNWADPVSCDLHVSKASYSDATGGAVRRNKAGSITRTNRYTNIAEGVTPFMRGANGGYDSNLDCREQIVLCQKAYWNVPIFRNTIDLMTEFSCSEIYWTGGNVESIKFFKAWLKKIQEWSFQDQWFREYYRSGTVACFKLMATFDETTKKKFKEIFAAFQEDVPVRYIILNPADLQVEGAASFTNPNYFKVLNDYELNTLLNPKTDQDRELAAMIPELKKITKEGKSFGRTVLLPLDPTKLNITFYKKQDYEPLAVPMGFSVLEDINSKLEMKKMDIAVARTMQQMVLLVTMGSEDPNIGPPSEKKIAAMQAIFANQSVGRVLVSDFTTKVSFVVPDIGDILNPEKYQVLDNDIRLGLNNVLFGEGKFADTTTKVNVFLARLEHSREAFLQNFLIPEVEKIGKALKFDKIPIPHFYDSDFKDDILRSRIYTQLAQYGLLTPEETIQAIRTGRLPEPDESLKSQEEFKKFKDEDLYAPIVMSAPKEVGPDGRPIGAKSPQTTKKKSPVGTGPQSKANYSLSSMKDALTSLSVLEKRADRAIKSKYNLKKLNAEQKEVLNMLVETVITNEPKNKWFESLAKYLDNPIGENVEVQSEINEIAAVHGLDTYSAALLYHSKLN